MFEERLPTRFWVDALLRQAQLEGASGFILHKGDPDRGDVLIKVSTLDGQARAYVPRTDMDGKRLFVDLISQGVGPEETAVDEYIQSARRRDFDLWVVEIEDREGRHFLSEPVEKLS